MKKIVLLLFVVLAIGGGFYYVRFLRAEAPPSFRTAEVTRGDLFLTISATGTVEPEEIVDVGTQVVGRIKEFGDDPRSASDPEFKDKHVDFGTPVEEGTTLAQIDESLYLATRNQAKAGLDRAKADLIQLRARLAQTTAEWNRALKLRELKLTSISGLGANGDKSQGTTTIKGISDSDFVLAKANFEVAAANVDVGESVVAQQQAMLDSAETNLGYTTIKSPVKGTIIARRVNIGQTVVSSLNAPSLFLIAKDLRRLEVWTHVNEADIGQLKVGMPVHFSVDAFRDEVFEGEVRQVRLDAQVTNNVITYTVAVSTNNDDFKLLPYLSADVKFEVDERRNVIKLPNAAMRYRPRPELIMPAPPSATPSPGNADADKNVDPSKNAASNNHAASEGDSDVRTVWVRHGNFVYPVEVKVGMTDSSTAETEILSGNLKEGTEIVVGENVTGAPPTEGNNPFAPPRFRGSKKKKAA